MLSTESNASGVALASGIWILYLVSKNRFSETMEKESTMPPEISGVSKPDFAVVVFFQVLFFNVIENGVF